MGALVLVGRLVEAQNIQQDSHKEIYMKRTAI